MRSYVRILTLCLVVVSFVNCEQYRNTTLKRGKRYLDYIEKSRIFFRANVKGNILKVNQLFAHAYGFRANYPIENDKKHRPFRRDVYTILGELMDHHGLHGKACVQRSFCDAARPVEGEPGMFYKLFKLMFTIPEYESHLYKDIHDGSCDIAHLCPLSLANVSPFTDDV